MLRLKIAVKDGEIDEADDCDGQMNHLVFQLATTALITFTINTDEEPERAKINK